MNQLTALMKLKNPSKASKMIKILKGEWACQSHASHVTFMFSISYSVENAYIEEKEDACNAIGEIADNIG